MPSETAKCYPSVTSNTVSRSGFLSPSEAANIVGVSKKAILEWCSSGKLAAHPKAYGRRTTYQIPFSALELLIQEQQAKASVLSKSEKSLKQQSEQMHEAFVQDWLKAMSNGSSNGKVYSELTINDYRFYLTDFLNRHHILTVKTLQAELMRLPASAYARRFKLYKACVCFAKFLILHQAIEPDFLERVKPYFPKRHAPPKRTCLDEKSLNALLKACHSLDDTVMVSLLAFTGLRVSEACALCWADADLVLGHLVVRRGKGGKERKLGLNGQLLELLSQTKEDQEPSSEASILRDESGRSMTRHTLYKKLVKLGSKAGVSVTPHALRRAFVTINAAKGRPLPILQRSCGHGDIKTTMLYCRIAEEEVINAMKGWD
jgi:integrase